MKRTIIITLLIPIFFILSGMSLFKSKEYQLLSFRGKVVNTETKEPIEGAAVLVVYHGSTTSVAGSNYYPVDAQEILTNADGEFNIPKKSVRSQTISGTARGNITIFKPGYGVFPRHRSSEAVGENKSWPPPKKYIVYELPKLKSIEERAKTVLGLRVKYDLQFSKQDVIIEKINEEFKHLGMTHRYIEKDGKPIRTIAR